MKGLAAVSRTEAPQPTAKSAMRNMEYCPADGCRPEEDHAQAEEDKARDHSSLIAPATHDERGGDSHYEVAGEVSGRD